MPKPLFDDALSLWADSLVAVAIVDSKGVFVGVNAAFCSLLAKPQSALLTRADFSLSCPCDISQERKLRAALSKETRHYQLEKRYLVDAKLVWVNTFVSRVYYVDEPYLLIAAVDTSRQHKLFTRLQDKQKQLRKLVEQDSLTLLKARASMLAEIEDAFARYHSDGSNAVLIFVDVDNFKAINDNHGHLVGDRVLKAIADKLQRSIRHTDVAGRIGGDEFALLLRQTTARNINHLLARIAVPIAFHYQEIRLDIRLSIGACVLDKRVYDAKDWLNKADKRMYAMKQAKSHLNP